MDDSSMVGGAAIVVALLTEAGKKMVTPVSEQLGLALGDLAGFIGSIRTRISARYSQGGPSGAVTSHRSLKRT